MIAVALVRFGEVATIALEECARRAAGAVDRAGRSVLALIEQAPAPPYAEKQGPRTDRPRRLAADDAASRASGDLRVSRKSGRETCLCVRARMPLACSGWLPLSGSSREVRQHRRRDRGCFAQARESVAASRSGGTSDMCLRGCSPWLAFPPDAMPGGGALALTQSGFSFWG